MSSMVRASTDVNPKTAKTSKKDVSVTTGSTHFPFVVIQGVAESDRAFCLKTRFLVALQQRYGASFACWTPPLSIKDFARDFGKTPLTMYRALRHLVEGGYIEKHYVSRPKAPRAYQYKLVAPMPGWLGGGE